MCYEFQDAFENRSIHNMPHQMNKPVIIILQVLRRLVIHNKLALYKIILCIICNATF